MSHAAGKKQILVVDDDASVAVAFKRLLCAQGYAVCTAASCADALAAILRERFDLYLIDMHLPDGEGYELLGRMNAVSRAPAIGISSDGDPQHVARAIGVGFVDYLVKPVRPELLRQRIGMRL
jgi:DNA-binding response OmpR family regulator